MKPFDAFQTFCETIPMSDEQATAMTATEEATTVTVTPPKPEADFEYDELQQFDADDVTAGSVLCKMLSLFFFYTVTVMAIAGAWTLVTIAN